jgi:hypothetical protein
MLFPAMSRHMHKFPVRLRSAGRMVFHRSPLRLPYKVVGIWTCLDSHKSFPSPCIRTGRSSLQIRAMFRHTLKAHIRVWFAGPMVFPSQGCRGFPGPFRRVFLRPKYGPTLISSPPIPPASRGGGSPETDHLCPLGTQQVGVP